MDGIDPKGLLIGYLEGELDADQRARVEFLLETDPEFAAEYRELGGLDRRFRRIGAAAWEAAGIEGLQLSSPRDRAKSVAGGELLAHHGESVDDLPELFDAPAIEAVPAAGHRPSPIALFFRGPLGMAVAACFFFMAGVATWHLTQQGGDPIAAVQNPAGVRVATVLESTDVQWAVERPVLSGHPVAVAANARVQLRTTSNVLVWLDGETTVIFDSEREMHIAGGRAFLQVTDGAGVHTIHTPSRAYELRGAQVEVTPQTITVRQGSALPVDAASRGPVGAAIEPGVGEYLNPGGAITRESVTRETIGTWTGQFAPPGVRPPAPAPAPPSPPGELTTSQVAPETSPDGEVSSFSGEEAQRLGALGDLAHFLPPDTNAWFVVPDARTILRPMLLLLADYSRDPIARLREAMGFELGEEFNAPLLLALDAGSSRFVIAARMENPTGATGRFMEALGRPLGWSRVATRVAGDWFRGDLGLQGGVGFGQAPYIQRLHFTALDSYLLVSNTELASHEAFLEYGRRLDPDWTAGIEVRDFVQTEFFRRSVREIGGPADVFAAVDVKGAVTRAMRQSPRFWKGSALVGFENWEILTTRVSVEEGRLVAQGTLSAADPGPMLGLLSPAPGHPLLNQIPEDLVGVVSLNLASAPRLYDWWREVLLEFEFEANAGLLGSAERAFQDRTGYSLRDGLLPLVAGNVAIAAVTGGDGGLEMLALARTPDAVLAERMLHHALESHGAILTPGEWKGLPFTTVSVGDAPPAMFLASTGDALVAATGWDAMRRHLDLRAGTDESTETRSFARAWGGGVDTASAVVAYGDLGLIHKLAHDFLALPGDLGGGGIAGNPLVAPGRVPLLLFLQPGEGGLAFRALASLTPGGLLGLGEMMRMPGEREQRLQQLVQQARRNLDTVSGWVRRFYVTHNRLPSDLEELFASGIAYPLFDTFTPRQSRRFGYRATGEDEWMLWSVGPDRIDDEGEVNYDEADGLVSPGDIVVTGRMALDLNLRQ